jgi:hypothetical protein
MMAARPSRKLTLAPRRNSAPSTLAQNLLSRESKFEFQHGGLSI